MIVVVKLFHGSILPKIYVFPSITMKHLAVRPKKMQLIEDRRQLIAFENVKLMERMAKIMSSSPEHIEHMKTPGKNETFRRREAMRVQLENRQMMERLQAVHPVLSSAKLEHDFAIHQRDVKTLQKRVMKPRRKHRTSEYKLTDTSISSLDELDSNSVTSMAQFRKQYIGRKNTSPSMSTLTARNQSFLPRLQPLSGATDSFTLFHSER